MPEHQIIVEIDIEAPPERVFDAWTDPAQLAEWWGDDATYRTRDWSCDVRPGGRWHCHGTAGGKMEGPWEVGGEYTVVERPSRLGFTWVASWDGGRTTNVLVELAPAGSGTRLRLTHTGFATVEGREGHHEGWKKVLSWLDRYAAAGRMAR